MGEDKDKATRKGLKMAEKAKKPRGKQPKFSQPGEMQSAVDTYFLECEANSKRATVAGLALALGFTSRQSILNYEDKPDYVDIIKKARLKLQDAAETSLLDGKNPIGNIFWLKNQGAGESWRDTQQLEHTGENGGPINITVQQFGAKRAEKPAPA